MGAIPGSEDAVVHPAPAGWGRPHGPVDRERQVERLQDGWRAGTRREHRGRRRQNSSVVEAERVGPHLDGPSAPDQVDVVAPERVGEAAPDTAVQRGNETLGGHDGDRRGERPGGEADPEAIAISAPAAPPPTTTMRPSDPAPRRRSAMVSRLARKRSIGLTERHGPRPGQAGRIGSAPDVDRQEIVVQAIPAVVVTCRADRSKRMTAASTKSTRSRA